MQILQPLPNQPFGPGFFWTAQTDFIGPIELGSFYEITAFPQTGEQVIGKGVKESQLKSVASTPLTFRNVSCCPANDAPGKSSAVALDRTANEILLESSATSS